MEPVKVVRIITGQPVEVEAEVNSLSVLYQPLSFGFYVVGDQLVATCTMVLKSELPRGQAQPVMLPPGFDPRRH